jgi:hypothetical protein
LSREWPFADPPRTAAFTVRRVFEQGTAILLVTHDADDGGWQFHDGDTARTADAMIVALEEVLAVDPTVAEVADLPLGWTATRRWRGDPWVRAVAPAGFVCEECGEEHEGPVLDVGFRRPDACLRVPDAERERRCTESDDLVSVDDRAWFLRGVLPIPLTDHDDDAALGVWVQVSRQAFERYRVLFDDPDGAREPPFAGTLATTVRGLPPTEGLPVEVRLTSAEERPRVRVLGAGHPLASHQTRGMALQDWMRLLHAVIDAED